MNSKKILITLGDPNGIGLEITLKSLRKLSSKILSSIEIIGLESSWCPYYQEFPNINFHAVDSSYISELGILSPQAGDVALKSINKAIDLLQKENYHGLITAPISKEAIVLSGQQNFSGHTGYFAEKFNVSAEMIFWCPKWSVILMTTHIPLQNVSQNISTKRCEEVFNHAIRFNEQYYNKPIAVCGLNPHAGENGIIGKEELEIIIPIIKKFQKKYPIQGPFAADTIFSLAENQTYGVVIAMYHDQALIPFKLLHFHDGVNISLGLPFIRTSPDHGTAFDIANKNIANYQSMLNAINFIIKDINLH